MQDRDYRCIDKNLTKLEKLVVCMIYTEKMTVKETAYVLDIQVFTVETLLLHITGRIIGDDIIW